MKLGRYILSIVFLCLFILFALANDEFVRISFPNILGINSGRSIYLPIYLFASLAIFFGLAIGVFIEYSRNFKLRKAFYENKKITHSHDFLLLYKYGEFQVIQFFFHTYNYFWLYLLFIIIRVLEVF